MADVDRLFFEYVAALKAGADPDPRGYLDQLDGAADRDELEALMDGHLVRTPAREWDPEAFRGSAAERFVEAFGPLIAGDAGVWPTLLPQLRNSARLKRSELVERLAAALGVAGKAEKVGDYYHRMEQGALPVEGVSDRVLDALGAIVGRSGAALRAAGRAMAPPAGASGPGAEVFARTAAPDPSHQAAPAPPAAAPATPEWDDVDELFRGRAT